MRLILASGSARRRDLMTMCGYEFSVIPCAAEEEHTAASPAELVERLSLAKARAVFDSLPEDEKTEAVVVGSDTVVALEGRIIGKPADEADAFDILKAESGKTNVVFTGVAVVSAAGESVTHDEATVRFAELTDDEINAYIATGEPMDKAGAYAIQGRFSLFINGIEGSYHTVVGLPVHLLYPMLAARGVKPKWL